MSAEIEIWREVPGYGGGYLASSNGRIKAKERSRLCRVRNGTVAAQTYKERLLNPYINGGGYLEVRIGHDRKKFTVTVHKLVLLAFVGPKPVGFEACHCNGIKTDNRPENLRWDSHLANNRDRLKHGTYPVGEKHPMARFTDAQARAIHRGEIGRAEAMSSLKISHSHFYRLKKGGRKSINGHESN